MQALVFAKEVFGDASIELTPSYLTLAEANLGGPAFLIMLTLPLSHVLAELRRPWPPCRAGQV
jgi:hypothetical protein